MHSKSQFGVDICNPAFTDALKGGALHGRVVEFP